MMKDIYGIDRIASLVRAYSACVFVGFNTQGAVLRYARTLPWADMVAAFSGKCTKSN